MTETATRRPYAPRMVPEERREHLLDAVLRVIVNHGVHKVSMDSVAKEAGVTRPVVYGHFPDSQALLRASLEREESAALAQLAAVMPDRDRETPTEAVVASLVEFLTAVLAAPDRWRAIFSLVDSSTPQFRSRLERGRGLMIGAMEDLVTWGVEERSLDADTDVEMLARLLFAFFWEAGRLVLAQPEIFGPDRIAAFARSTVTRFVTSQ